MTEQQTLARFYKGWDVYQQRLINVITPLTPEQLALQAAPHHWPIGVLATHIVAARAGWFHLVLKEGSSDFAPLASWDNDELPARTSAELVAGLEATWQMIQ